MLELRPPGVGHPRRGLCWRCCLLGQRQHSLCGPLRFCFPKGTRQRLARGLPGLLHCWHCPRFSARVHLWDSARDHRRPSSVESLCFGHLGRCRAGGDRHLLKKNRHNPHHVLDVRHLCGFFCGDVVSDRHSSSRRLHHGLFPGGPMGDLRVVHALNATGVHHRGLFQCRLSVVPSSSQRHHRNCSADVLGLPCPGDHLRSAHRASHRLGSHPHACWRRHYGARAGPATGCKAGSQRRQSCCR
mmetsp:Transcript_25064/g.54539  ORF Transcript_25064/g.54539 Transcript_25064/m.54539 type:complete len:243 (+) Transcript_25064:493-1221(+)